MQCVVVNAHVAQYDSDFFPGTPNDIPDEDDGTSTEPRSESNRASKPPPKPPMKQNYHLTLISTAVVVQLKPPLRVRVARQTTVT